MTRSMMICDLVRAARLDAQNTARSHSSVSSMTTRYLRLWPFSKLLRLVLIVAPGPCNAKRTHKHVMVAWPALPREGGSFCPAQTAELAPHEADDVLDRLHGFRGDDLRARSTLGEHGIDIDRVLDQLLHLRADRPELGDGEID